jgi:hypothetical protein
MQPCHLLASIQLVGVPVAEFEFAMYLIQILAWIINKQ